MSEDKNPTDPNNVVNDPTGNPVDGVAGEPVGAADTNDVTDGVAERAVPRRGAPETSEDEVAATAEPVDGAKPASDAKTAGGHKKAAGEAKPVQDAEPEKKDRKRLFIILAVIALVAIIGGVVLYMLTRPGNALNPEPAPAKPLEKGAYIIVPDNLDGGKANADKKIGSPVKDSTAPKYDDPKSLSDYRIVKDDGSVLLKSPLDGPCAYNALGNILPPNNYMHSCYYEKNGAVVYTSHAVIGSRTGALENIQYLKQGQIVKLADVDYKVTRVETFDANKLPPYLLKKGTVALLTCHIDSSTKSFEDFTKSDVAFLEKA